MYMLARTMPALERLIGAWDGPMCQMRFFGSERGSVRASILLVPRLSAQGRSGSLVRYRRTVRIVAPRE